MDKDKLKDLLFKMLNENSALPDVLLDNKTDTIFVKGVMGKSLLLSLVQ